MASGVFTVGMTVSPSDNRFKKNFRPIENPLQKVMGLNGVSYNWKSGEYKERGFSDEPQIGLIAQEVEQFFPELVHTDADGYKAVAYSKMVAVLVEAVKELKTENEKLKVSVHKQQAQLQDQKTKFDQMLSKLELLKEGRLVALRSK